MISPPVKISSPALFFLYLSFLKALIVLSIFQPVVKTVLFNRSGKRRCDICREYDIATSLFDKWVYLRGFLRCFDSVIMSAPLCIYYRLYDLKKSVQLIVTYPSIALLMASSSDSAFTFCTRESTSFISTSNSCYKKTFHFF